MTHDFIEDAAEACNRDKVPFIFAMRSGGDQGAWRVTYNLEHDKNCQNSDLVELIRFLLAQSEFDTDKE